MNIKKELFVSLPILIDFGESKFSSINEALDCNLTAFVNLYRFFHMKSSLLEYGLYTFESWIQYLES